MTRVKICGITRAEDAVAAARLGADAIGLMFYPPSPRCVTPEQARRIAAALPPFVTLVGVFVDPAPDEVRAALSRVPLQLLQFHGDEAPEFCAGFGLGYIKAARVRPGLDLIQYAARHAAARGLLLDAYVPGAHGGTGQSFDWSLIPGDLPLPLVLSGGLDASNVAEAVRRVRPWAVDVSSGVESARGIKDPARISAFIRGVRDADV
jgi:phosphoribosylanthranilate isomerase